MENITEVFKDKNFDDITLKYINNFIDEFDDLFGQYVNRDEVIKRIKENLNESFVFEEIKNVRGRYKSKDKRIVLSDKVKDEEELKSVIFHEMIHVITTRTNYIGFSKSYISEDYENVIVTCRGVTEGFTQLVTQIRNAKYYSKKSDNAYPILTEQITNLADLIGMEKFLNSGFNEPESLFDIMRDARLIENEEVELQVFLDNFDVIWKNEAEIYKSRYKSKSPESKLFNAIFGENKKEQSKVSNAKIGIVSTFLTGIKNKKIENIDDLKELYKKNKLYASQLDAEDVFDNYSIFWGKTEELISNGINRENLLSELNGELRQVIYEKFIIDDFISLTPEEKLEKLNENEELYNLISESKFSSYYKEQIVREVFGYDDVYVFNNRNENYEAEHIDRLFDHLFWGLSKEIIDKGYDIRKLSIEYIDFKRLGGVTYNLYENDGQNVKYLSTYSDANMSFQLEELKLVSSEEFRIQIVEKFENIPENAILFKDSNGCILAYLGDDDYIFIDEAEETYSNKGNTTYNPNRIEYLCKRMETRISRYKAFEEIRNERKSARR